MTPTDIARVAHEVNSGYTQAISEPPLALWDDLPAWQRYSVHDGVAFLLANPEAGPSASHANWLALKRATGWRHGPVKDMELKEHPCFLVFEALPVEQQAKDYIFHAIVRSLARYLPATYESANTRYAFSESDPHSAR